MQRGIENSSGIHDIQYSFDCVRGIVVLTSPMPASQVITLTLTGGFTHKSKVQVGVVFNPRVLGAHGGGGSGILCSTVQQYCISALLGLGEDRRGR